MGIKYYKAVWSESKAKSSHKLTMLALAEVTNESTGQCNPSHQTLASMVGVTDRQIRKILEELATAGEIEIVTFRGRTHTNQYNILLNIGTVVPVLGQDDDTENRNSSVKTGNGVPIFEQDNRNQGSDIPAKIGTLARENRNCSSYEPIEPITTTTTTTSLLIADAISESPEPQKAKGKSKKCQSEPAEVLERRALLKTAYVGALGHENINHAQVGAGIKQLEHSGCTPEELGDCYVWLKEDPFWRFKPISPQTIFKFLPEYRRWRERAADRDTGSRPGTGQAAPGSQRAGGAASNAAPAGGTPVGGALPQAERRQQYERAIVPWTAKLAQRRITEGEYQQHVAELRAAYGLPYVQRAGPLPAS